MKRRIFVGSSTEHLDRAREVCDLLSSSDTEGVLWNTVFQPGLLTLEALELMLRDCCGAVFVATADDESNIRGKRVHVPRANVMLEFGLVAGRMGHHSVAICRYDRVMLPTDLTGLTDIPMDCLPHEHDPGTFRVGAVTKLRNWAANLLPTVRTVPRTDILHGYTGSWDFNLQLQKWRSLEISPPSSVQVGGSFDLIIAPSGQAGRGFIHSHVFAKLINGKDRYEADYRSAQKITNALCRIDGSLVLRTQAFVLQAVNSMGTTPPELTGLDIAPDPWSARWELCPCAESRTLQGTVRSDSSGTMEGTVDATKSADVP